MGINEVEGFGYMNTMAAMWGWREDFSSVCSLDSESGFPHCPRNMSIPPPAAPLWAVNGGGHFSCGLLNKDRTPVCWGESPATIVPTKLRKMSYSLLNCGGWHACGIRSSSGKVDCWGDNQYGQSVPPNVRMKSISLGKNFSCGLKLDSRAICWGDTAGFQYDTSQVFHSIYAGSTHVCGILPASQTAVCWGSNIEGESFVPTEVSFSALSLGSTHTCGIMLEAHEVLCWGRMLRKPLPHAGFSVIASAEDYACGLRIDPPGDMLCWTSERVLVSRASFRTRQGICVDKCHDEEFNMATKHYQQHGCTMCVPCARCPDGSSLVEKCGVNTDTVCSSNEAGFPIPIPPSSGHILPSSSNSARFSLIMAVVINIVYLL